jgi:predicted NBD/HSP70 family sugar kinase
VESEILSLADGDLEGITIDHVFQAVDRGDRLASNLMEKAAGYIGLSAANLVNVLSPELLLLAGAMVQRGGGSSMPSCAASGLWSCPACGT